MEQRGSGPPHEHWLAPWCAWLALVVPLAVTVLRVSPSAQWRDDLAVVRGLGLVPVGGEGVLSAALMQLASLVPVGGRLMRAALISALGLALGSRLLYALTRRLLDAAHPTPLLGAALALSSSLTITLGATWQLEGSIAGGATLAVALVLLGLTLRPSASTRDVRLWLGYGALLAAAGLESHAAALALLLALSVQTAWLGELPSRRSIAWLLGGAGSVAAVGLLPVALRPLAQRAWVDLGRDLGTLSLRTAQGSSPLEAAMAWQHDAGLLLGVAALGGAAWGVLRPSTRWLSVPLLALLGADLVYPTAPTSALAIDALAPVRLLALAALGPLAALGVHVAVGALSVARLPFARPASALLVAFSFTVALVTLDDSGYVADRGEQHGAEVYTDEALGQLPPRALVLVRSEALAWRLWAARVVRGERPDVVVVPLHLLDRGSVARRLLAMEPGLAPLIRDMAMKGRPGEHALSSLADLRPLYVELDERYDPRLLPHLTPAPLWLVYRAQPLGRSDRALGLPDVLRAAQRVGARALEGARRDEATLSVLEGSLGAQARLLAALGERASARAVLDVLQQLQPSSLLLRELRPKVAPRHPGAQAQLDPAP